MLAQLLTSIDSCLTSSLAATLAGLSISSAAFLTNLLNTRKDDSDRLSKHVQSLKAEYEDKHDIAEKAAINTLLDGATRRLNKVRNLITQSSLAIKYLLIAFTAFIIELLESVILDPIADQTVASQLEALKNNLFEQLEVWDVVLSGGALIIGLIFLSKGAWAIYRCSHSTD